MKIVRSEKTVGRADEHAQHIMVSLAELVLLVVERTKLVVKGSYGQYSTGIPT